MIWLILIPLFLILLYLFMICPSLKPSTENFFEDWSFAHRGLHSQENNVPENSMEAFRLAVENGYGIEMDVHITKDGVAVVHHDGNLLRTCHVDVPIRNLHYDELCGYPLSDGSYIPKLTEVLRLVEGRVPLIVEIKRESGVTRCAEEVLRILKTYSGPYCVESFDPRAMGVFRKKVPDVIRGQLTQAGHYQKGNWFWYFSMKYLLGNFISRPHFLAVNVKKDRSLSYTLCTKLFRAYPVGWTVRSRKEAEESFKKGYRNLIFEHFHMK